MRQVLLQRGEDDWWVAEALSLPGCVTQGRTRTDAIVNAREAIALYLEVMSEDDHPIPEERFEAIIVAV